MDNLTHTLVGLAAGELVTRTTRVQSGGLPEGVRRTALLVIGMIGNNLPDSDLLWSMGGDRLSYELHHRGYTHTVLGCVLLALLLYAATVLCLRRLRHHLNRQDHWLLAEMAVFSVLLHLGMDALNSYGVHPFWPLDNRWFYGDSVFIVEPLYWLAAAPLLLVLRTVAPRVLLGLILLIGNVAILFVHRFAPMWWLVPLVTSLLAASGRVITPRHSAVVSALLMLGVTTMFLVAGKVAAARVNAVLQAEFPGLQTLDVVLTPSPAQPLCWDALVLQRKADDYAVRTGRFTLVGNQGAAVCPVLGAVSPSEDRAEGPGMQWGGEYMMSIAQFNTLVQGDCRAREALQFVRAPWLAHTGQGWSLSDLRFGGNDNRGLGAVLVRTDAQNDCHYHVPWTPPRGDLLL